MGIDEEPVENKRIDWKDQEAQRRSQVLVQLGSNIALDQSQVDENVEIAQAYLEERFPEDFPKPPPPPKPAPKQPSPEEIAEKESKELIKYSARVADEAKAYQQELKSQESEQREAKALAKMGYEEKFKPEFAPKPAPLPTDLRLVQLSQEIKIDGPDSTDNAFDPDAKRALDYLSQQFPKDFPPDKEDKPAPPKPAPVVPKEVIERQENQKVLKHSEQALQAAEDYHSELVQMEKDEKEKAEIAQLMSPTSTLELA